MYSSVMRKQPGRDVGTIVRSAAALLAVGLALAACSPAPLPRASAAAVRSPVNNPAPSHSRSAVASTKPAPASSLTLADAATCPVTIPGEAPAEIRDRLFGAAGAFGNSDLWVGGLGPDGVIPADPQFVETDGSIGWKLGWWRVVSGTLAITGHRIDTAAPPLRASVPDGYGTKGFQASGVYFSTEGCWEVTGTIGSSELTFVTFVLRT